MSQASGAFSVGDKVLVEASLTFYNVPGFRNGLDVKGFRGTIIRVYNEPNLSPDDDFVIEFEEPKWKGHFKESEVAHVGGATSVTDTPAAFDLMELSDVSSPPSDRVETFMTPVEGSLILRPSMQMRTTAQLLQESGRTGAPVADEEGRLCGVLTQFDFLYQEASLNTGHRAGEALNLGFAEWQVGVRKALAGTVRSAMSKPVAVSPNADMSLVASLMVQKRFNHVPVVHADGAIAGILTSQDVLRHILSKLPEDD